MTVMRVGPPLLSSLPPTIRSILSNASKGVTARSSPSSATLKSSPSSQTQSSSSHSTSTLPTDSTSTCPPPDAESTTVRGWIKSVRGHKNVVFATLSDGSTSEVLQAVFRGGPISDEICLGAGVELTGRLGASRGAGQAVELLVEKATVLGTCDQATYPIQKKHIPEHVLRESAHLRFKTTLTSSIMRVRDATLRDFHDWFEDHEFTFIHTPVLTGSDCEGAGEVFSLNSPLLRPSTPTPGSDSKGEPFFPHQVNLTVSSQLHLEAPTLALGRAYTLSPSFRAEPSMTSRHLSEFYMLEGEAVVERLDDLLDIVESGIRSVLSRVVDTSPTQTERSKRIQKDLSAILTASIPEGQPVPRNGVDFLQARPDLVHAAQNPFTRIEYTDAVDLLTSHHDRAGFSIRAEWGEGLASEHEKWLAEHFGGPVFVTHYPASLKPFYMLPSDAEAQATTTTTTTTSSGRGPTVACFDLLIPNLGELIGGSLREHRLQPLLDSIAHHKMKKEEYEWYLDLRRFGSLPHGGWGMGWERWISYLTGVGNVRDVVAFPRWVGHCKY